MRLQLRYALVVKLSMLFLTLLALAAVNHAQLAPVAAGIPANANKRCLERNKSGGPRVQAGWN